MKRALWFLYLAIDAATFVWLAVEGWDSLNWWNWIILLPIWGFLSTIWPIYWVILRPIFGA